LDPSVSCGFGFILGCIKLAFAGLCCLLYGCYIDRY